MKKNFKLALTSLALLAFGLSACNDNGGHKGNDYTHNNKLVESVTLSSEYETCEIGDSFELSSLIKFKDDEPVEISKRWASSKISVARLTVAEDKNSAQVDVVGSGTTQISFIAGFRFAICTVYVPASEVTPTPDPDPEETNTKITLSYTSRTLSLNDEFSLSATVFPLEDAIFASSNGEVITITDSSASVCKVKAVGAGQADVLVTAGDATAKCHVTVLGEQQQGDKDYTVYFFIDYNNADPKDETGTKLLAKFDWYKDRPLSEAAGQLDDFDRPCIPTVTNDMKTDPAFPYFLGWSTHPIIDEKKNLWDMNKDTIQDLPMKSYTVYLYGQWFDVASLPA